MFEHLKTSTVNLQVNLICVPCNSLHIRFSQKINNGSAFIICYAIKNLRKTKGVKELEVIKENYIYELYIAASKHGRRQV